MVGCHQGKVCVKMLCFEQLVNFLITRVDCEW
jgi:hypothetical protein